MSELEVSGLCQKGMIHGKMAMRVGFCVKRLVYVFVLVGHCLLTGLLKKLPVWIGFMDFLKRTRSV